MEELTMHEMGMMTIPIPKTIEKLIKTRYSDAPTLFVGAAFERGGPDDKSDTIPVTYVVSDIDPFGLLARIRAIIADKKLDLADKVMDINTVLKTIEEI